MKREERRRRKIERRTKRKPIRERNKARARISARREYLRLRDGNLTLEEARQRLRLLDNEVGT
jgi:hypothetical protein